MLENLGLMSYENILTGTVILYVIIIQKFALESNFIFLVLCDYEIYRIYNKMFCSYSGRFIQTCNEGCEQYYCIRR